MIRVYFIRHSLTAGNEKKRYIGITDEPLSEAGRTLTERIRAPEAALLFSSPMLRCIESAGILYPSRVPIIVHGLRECDFGEFENQNAAELSKNPNYQRWIDSSGNLPFPGGESREEFLIRNSHAFEDAVNIILERRANSAVFLVHGGTIMNLLSYYGRPQKDFYAWHVDNGCGYEAELSELLWIEGRKQLRIIKKITGGNKN